MCNDPVKQGTYDGNVGDTSGVDQALNVSMQNSEYKNTCGLRTRGSFQSLRVQNARYLYTPDYVTSILDLQYSSTVLLIHDYEHNLSTAFHIAVHDPSESHPAACMIALNAAEYGGHIII